MEFYLKTKEECDTIVQNNEAFIKAERFVEDCNVVIYDYRLAALSDFVNEEAFELRGLCFVEQPDGSWKRNLLMNKFFNVSQCSMDDLYEIELDNGDILKVGETHIFKLKNGKTKMARNLTENDDIVGWDNLTELQ